MVNITEVSESSSSGNDHNKLYDVYLSFRGVDTRLASINHLHKALESANLKTFLDDEEIHAGVDLKLQLEIVIKRSRASIIVLSKNYALSTWCLDELVLILEQHKTCGQIVIPIFYHVEPRDVRKQHNSFGNAITIHKQMMEEETDVGKRSKLTNKIHKWNEALTQVSDLKGHEARGRSETEFIEEIVDNLYRTLGGPLSSSVPLLIGMEKSVKHISLWLKDESSNTADILTISGISGIGKTSLADYVYKLYHQEFKASGFIEDISKRCAQFDGILGLQKQLLENILKRSPFQVHRVSEYTSYIEQALSRKKVFLVLDNINSPDQLDVLLGNKSLHPGSKIIITTKDASLTEGCALFKLQVQFKHTHHFLIGLNHDASLRLLSFHAFNSEEVKEGYEEVSDDIVKFCRGIPLALITMGSLLYKREVAYWEDCLKQGIWISFPDINNILKESFESEQKMERIKIIRLCDIKLATDNFSTKYLIGQGAYGNVYKGELDEILFLGIQEKNPEEMNMKRTVAIKRILYNEKEQDEHGFFQHIEMFRRCKHYNIVELLGYCNEDYQKILVYEFVPNGSLDDYLGNSKKVTYLTWVQRLKISLDISYGLDYLHTNITDKERIIMWDITSAEILMGKNWEAKICDFKLSKFYFRSTVITYHTAGTVVYMDPEYLRTGRIKQESDIYSLGVVLFEILCGRLAYHNVYVAESSRGLAAVASKRFHEGLLKSIIDPKLIEEAEEHLSVLKIGANQESLEVFANIAIRCLEITQDKRPTIKVVIDELQKALNLQEKRTDIYKFSLEDIKLGTENFSDNNSIVREGSGTLYRGEVPYGNGRKTVVLKVSRSSEEHRFLNELEILFGLKHENVVELVGYCKEMDYKIIVYENVSKWSTLNSYVTDISLTWTKRLEICIDVANGLKFIHEGFARQQLIVHRDIKSANIVLDGHLNAKICGFEFSLISQKNQEMEYVVNDVVGSPGYSDPVYKETGFLTKESDIYSFGVILFEMLCGKPACSKDIGESNVFLYSLVKRHSRIGRLDEIVFDGIKRQIALKSLNTFQSIACQCLHEERKKRPTIDEVAVQLKLALEFQESIKIRLDDIKSATKSFDKEYLIGSGGFGDVYKAELNVFDENLFLGTEGKNPKEIYMKRITVAIKRIKNGEKGQGKQGFFLEIEMLRRCKHPNIVSLLGYCNEHSELILVYEFVPNGSLDDYLGNIKKETNLSWVQRIKISLDIAHGLDYLHSNITDKEKIIHRDIKSANILLSKDWEAKIADFGLSKFYHVNQLKSTMNTKTIVGTEVYLDPEYSEKGKLKKESDIYSLGVVLFELLSGKVAYDQIYVAESTKGLAEVARKRFNEGALKDIIDPELVEEADDNLSGLKIGANQESLQVFANIAIRCLEITQDKRPTMKVVIEELQNALNLQEKRKDIFKLSLDDIKLGTENFSDNKMIVREGNGMLYRGDVPYGDERKTVVMKVNRLREEHNFLKELEILFGLKHENILEVVGYCKEMDEKVVVYENVSKWGTLDSYVKDHRLTWTKRLEICIDVANGLKYLHGSFAKQQLIVHRDIKSSNIVLNEDWHAKICGFECSLISPKNQEMEYVVNDVVGSSGYSDPVYKETSFLTKESDIYSFGVVLFEMLCGRLACPNDFGESSEFLDSLVKSHASAGRLDEIVFDGIKGQIASKSLLTFQRIAYRCLHEERERRPTAEEVAVQLKKALEFQDIWDRSLKDRSCVKRDLYFLKLEEGDDLSDHIDTFNHLVCKLSNMDEIIKEEDLGLLMLGSLPKSYKPFVQNMSTDQTTTLKDVIQKLSDYNSRNDGYIDSQRRN